MRLIDDDVLKAAINRETQGIQMMIGSGDVLGIIDEQPTVEPVRQWISVKDRLPEKNGQYIVFGCSDAMKKFLPDCIPIWICDYSERNGGWYSIEMNRTIDYITHWMPLPEPPKEDK